MTTQVEIAIEIATGEIEVMTEEEEIMTDQGKEIEKGIEIGIAMTTTARKEEDQDQIQTKDPIVMAISNTHNLLELMTKEGTLSLLMNPINRGKLKKCSKN